MEIEINSIDIIDCIDCEIDFKTSICDLAVENINRNNIFPDDLHRESGVIESQSQDDFDEINSERVIYLLNIDEMLEENLLHKY